MLALQRKMPGKITNALAVAVTFLLAAVRIGGQAESTQKLLMAEQYFKDVFLFLSLSGVPSKDRFCRRP